MTYASVTDVVRRIKENVQRDYRLHNVAVEGNIMGLKRASAGHYYMTLHDDTCSLRAVLFRSCAGRSMENVREGDHVVVIGTVNVYEKGGTVSFIIERLFSQGQGSLQMQYEHIKQEMLAKGYFDACHKKALPRFPWRVGVLTSQTGAVIHDIRKIAAERNPYISIHLFPIPVQGNGAEKQIAETLQKAGKTPGLDVLIVARGGGSAEDLWCFNSPDVVKAVYDVSVPVITAIGHETDTTLADYAADVRAATPTHAAEMAFPDIYDLKMNISAMKEQICDCMRRSMERREQLVRALAGRVQLGQYRDMLALRQDGIKRCRRSACQQMKAKLDKQYLAVDALQGKLQALNPAAVLQKGYGQISQDGHLITSVVQVDREIPLDIQLADGQIRAAIKEVR